MSKSQQNPQESTPQSVGSFSPPQAVGCKKHIPNILTGLRLLATPVCIWTIIHQHLILALCLYFATSITDWLDGYLARRWGATSEVGKILDPIADKILIFSVYLTLALYEFIPLWLSAIVIARDMLILFIACCLMIARGPKLHIPPLFIGKLCVSQQMLFIGCILAYGQPLSFTTSIGILNELMVLFAYGVSFLTLITGIAYGWTVYTLLRK